MAKTPSLPKLYGQPGLVDRVNYLAALFEIPCQPDWTVMVQCAFPATLSLMIDFFSFTKRDIMKLRAGHSYRCGFKKLLEEAEQIKGESFSEGRTWLFAIEGGFDEAMWWGFIEMLPLEWLANWQSDVLLSTGCAHDDTTDHITCKQAPLTTYLNDEYNPTWDAQILQFTSGNHAFYGVNYIQLPPGDFSIGGFGRLEPIYGEMAGYGCQITHVDTGTILGSWQASDGEIAKGQYKAGGFVNLGNFGNLHGQFKIETRGKKKRGSPPGLFHNRTELYAAYNKNYKNHP